MNKLRKIAFDTPIIFSVILIIITVSITSIPLGPIFSNFLDYQTSEYITGILEQVFTSILLIVMLKHFNLLKIAGFIPYKQWKNLRIIWPMLLFTMLNGSDFILGKIVIDRSRPLVIVLFVLLYLSTGLFEEVLCRGVILTLMMRKWGNTKSGCYFALILSSAIFGVTHIIHFFLRQSSFIACVAQIIYATFIAVFFAACVLRNQSIFPVIILHAVVDISGSFKEIAVNGGLNENFYTMSLGNAIGCVIITLPLLLYGLFIFRKVTPFQVSMDMEEKLNMV